MLLHLILGLAALLAVASAGLFIVFVLGIRQGDHGKRLTGKPGNCAEALARRVLTGSCRCGTRSSAEDDR